MGHPMFIVSNQEFISIRKVNAVKLVLSGTQKDQTLLFKTDYCLMQVKSIADSTILSSVIKLPFSIKIFVLSIFKKPFYTGFTV